AEVTQFAGQRFDLKLGLDLSQVSRQLQNLKTRPLQITVGADTAKAQVQIQQLGRQMLTVGFQPNAIQYFQAGKAIGDSAAREMLLAAPDIGAIIAKSFNLSAAVRGGGGGGSGTGTGGGGFGRYGANLFPARG